MKSSLIIGFIVFSMIYSTLSESNLKEAKKSPSLSEKLQTGSSANLKETNTKLQEKIMLESGPGTWKTLGSLRDKLKAIDRQLEGGYVYGYGYSPYYDNYAYGYANDDYACDPYYDIYCPPAY